MRINIPWGGLFLIGGLLLVYATDVPAFIGWIAVAFGIFSVIMQIIALVIVGAGMKMFAGLTPDEAKEELEHYRTSHGRRLPRKQTQVTTLRSVKSDGDVTVDSKQTR